MITLTLKASLNQHKESVEKSHDQESPEFKIKPIGLKNEESNYIDVDSKGSQSKVKGSIQEKKHLSKSTKANVSKEFNPWQILTIAILGAGGIAIVLQDSKDLPIYKYNGSYNQINEQLRPQK